MKLLESKAQVSEKSGPGPWQPKLYFYRGMQRPWTLRRRLWLWGLGFRGLWGHIDIHTYIRTYVHMYIRTYVHTYIRTYIQINKHIYIYICMYI